MREAKISGKKEPGYKDEKVNHKYEQRIHEELVEPSDQEDSEGRGYKTIDGTREN